VEDLFFSAVDTKTKWKKHKVKHWFHFEIHHKRKLYKAMKHNPSDIHVKQEYRRVSNIVCSKTRHDIKEKAAAMSQLQLSNPWRCLSSIIVTLCHPFSHPRGTTMMIL